MAKIRYVQQTFRAATVKIVDQANAIIAGYAAQGYVLTLRQLYYQFVSRDLLENTQENYKRLGSIINHARLAGLIDWEAIEDRTRNLHTLPTWSSPESIVSTCAEQFHYDLWATQRYRVEVWIEKDALAGVFQRVCDELRLPLFACRGYTSQSEMWLAGRRLKGYQKKHAPIILYFGDHDPSGIDMTRDLRDRLQLFMGGINLQRLALNRTQVEQYSPPANPAKTTDSRFSAYLLEYGEASWELDALEPQVLTSLVRDFVLGIREDQAWQAAEAREQEARSLLQAIAGNWDAITENLP